MWCRRCRALQCAVQSLQSWRVDSSTVGSPSDSIRPAMPPVGYVYDPLYLEHEMPGHPESPARLWAIVAHLEESGVLARLTKIEPRDATPADIELRPPRGGARGGGRGGGRGKGGGDTLPPPRGCCREQYLRAYSEVAAPLLRRFGPQLLLVSAGFDAHFADPLAQMLLNTRRYYEIASLLKVLADELCEGRVVYGLEGGYDHTALAWSARACIDTLLGHGFAEDPLGAGPSVPGPDIDTVLAAVKRAHGLDGGGGEGGRSDSPRRRPPE